MEGEHHVFKASRWTRGNLFFPVRIEITAERVCRIKPRVFGASEESIPMAKVASVSIEAGLIWADVRIDSTGGANPILTHGHKKRDAYRIRDLVLSLRAAAPATAEPAPASRP